MFSLSDQESVRTHAFPIDSSWKHWTSLYLSICQTPSCFSLLLFFTMCFLCTELYKFLNVMNAMETDFSTRLWWLSSFSSCLRWISKYSVTENVFLCQDSCSVSHRTLRCSSCALLVVCGICISQNGLWRKIFFFVFFSVLYFVMRSFYCITLQVFEYFQ